MAGSKIPLFCSALYAVKSEMCAIVIDTNNCQPVTAIKNVQDVYTVCVCHTIIFYVGICICIRNVCSLHMLVCACVTVVKLCLQLIHTWERGEPEIIFSAPHEGALIQFKQLQGDGPLITYGDLGICLCL